MDLTTATQPPYIHAGVEYPILSVQNDLPKIAAAIRADRVEKANTLAAQKKFQVVEVFQLLLDIEWKPVKTREIFDYAQSPDGAARVLSTSLAKAGKTQDEIDRIIESLDPGDMVGLALIVSRGVRRPEPEAPADPLAAD